MRKISWLIVSLLIIVNIFFFVSSYKMIFGFQTLRVLSGSMRDTIQIDDLVLIHKENEYREKDIVTRKVSESYVTHRIVKIDDKEVVTKGDFNNTIDLASNVTDIVGKVIVIIPKNIYTIIRYSIIILIIFVIFLEVMRKDDKSER